MNQTQKKYIMTQLINNLSAKLKNISEEMSVANKEQFNKQAINGLDILASLQEGNLVPVKVTSTLKKKLKGITQSNPKQDLLKEVLPLLFVNKGAVAQEPLKYPTLKDEVYARFSSVLDGSSYRYGISLYHKDSAKIFDKMEAKVKEVERFLMLADAKEALKLLEDIESTNWSI